VEPEIDDTRLGAITIAGQTYEHDVVIRLGGKVKKRKKKLSKEVYGTSHLISRDEAEHIHDDGAERLIIGSGQHGNLALSEEAEEVFRRRRVKVEVYPTPTAIQRWNEMEGAVIALFHVTY
jgi:hypothetical protein